MASSKEIIIDNIYPPNFDTICAFLPAVLADKEAIFAYKDRIYNPYHLEITPDREDHEQVHLKQQNNQPEEWYRRYLSDSKFRLEQELEAYRKQYIFIKEHFEKTEAKLKGENKRFKDYTASKAIEWGLNKMAEALSSRTYGNLLSFGEAKSKIRHYEK